MNLEGSPAAAAPAIALPPPIEKFYEQFEALAIGAPRSIRAKIIESFSKAQLSPLEAPADEAAGLAIAAAVTRAVNAYKTRRERARASAAARRAAKAEPVVEPTAEVEPAA
jgi:hypothetical protein